MIITIIIIVNFISPHPSRCKVLGWVKVILVDLFFISFTSPILRMLHYLPSFFSFCFCSSLFILVCLIYSSYLFLYFSILWYVFFAKKYDSLPQLLALSLPHQFSHPVNNTIPKYLNLCSCCNFSISSLLHDFSRLYLSS